jgi:hypothetical protein
LNAGEGEDGLICVRFGMVTAETDVEELLNLVVTTGKEVEESSRFLESLTEIVKKGLFELKAIYRILFFDRISQQVLKPPLKIFKRKTQKECGRRESCVKCQ